MRSEEERSVVQVIFAWEEIIFVIHLVSELLKFIISRNKQGLMFLFFVGLMLWICCQMINTGLSALLELLPDTEGGEQGACPPSYALPQWGEMSGSGYIVVYCTRLASLCLPTCDSTTKRGNKNICPNLFLHRCTVCSLLIGKEKKSSGWAEPVLAWAICIVGKNTSGLRGGRMCSPWLGFKIFYLCKDKYTSQM